MADGKRGRRPDSPELKAAKQKLKAAKTDDAKAVVLAEIDAVKVREKEARLNGAGHSAPHVQIDDEKFKILVECEPRIREAERAAKEAADDLKAEREALAKAFGGAGIARKKLDLFRRAQTDEGEAEARALIEMHQRVAAWRNKPIGYIEDMFAPPVAGLPEVHKAA